MIILMMMIIDYYYLYELYPTPPTPHLDPAICIRLNALASTLDSKDYSVLPANPASWLNSMKDL